MAEIKKAKKDNMKKLRKEQDGSFGYVFNEKDLKKLILDKYPELIDDKHKFDEIDIGRYDIALMILPKKIVKKVNNGRLNNGKNKRNN